MAVRRIVANIATDRLDAARAFYGDLLGMSVVMDLGWITTFAADGIMAPQISVATEGGSGTTVPDLSIEVDNLSYTEGCRPQGWKSNMARSLSHELRRFPAKRRWRDALFRPRSIWALGQHLGTSLTSTTRVSTDLGH